MFLAKQPPSPKEAFGGKNHLLSTPLFVSSPMSPPGLAGGGYNAPPHNYNFYAGLIRYPNSYIFGVSACIPSNSKRYFTNAPTTGREGGVEKLTHFFDQDTLKFNEWLAGLIDGDGCFNLSKKDYASLEITLDVRDKSCLFEIKDKFGGSIKLGRKPDQKWLRYRLHDKKGLLALIKAVNGLLRNPTRLLQLGRICDKYGLILQSPSPLTYNNGWLSGFIDSDGSVYLSISSGQIFITASQKNKLLLEPLVELYGGKIYFLSKVQAYKWTVFSKREVSKMTEYFNMYPLKSKKMVRILLIKDIYNCFKDSSHRACQVSATEVDSTKGTKWNDLIKKWNDYM